MMIRLSKIAMVWLIALFMTLLFVGNVMHFGAHLDFVHQVLTVEATKSGGLPGFMMSPAVVKGSFVVMAVAQGITAVLCWLGGMAMYRWRHESNKTYHQSKHFAIMGLTISLIVWLAGALIVGAGWFGSWVLPHWNGTSHVFSMLTVVLLSLIYLTMANDEK